MAVAFPRDGDWGQLFHSDDEALLLLLCHRHGGKEDGLQSQGVRSLQGRDVGRPCLED